ncbi:hypothetical protein [Bacillus sp. FJAT-45037]|uniref:hypothetical protein n=1 Tax=Bacillus sp. FJAT-45037 TaxID=2011007 RepID=UPI000C24CFD4|nr:hypothetical protein [Bacillus sp. FJAT-45037]
MKRIGLGLLVLVILYSVYYDLTIGTLPNGLEATTQTEPVKPTTEPPPPAEESEEVTTMNEPFVEVTIEPGFTVLSIVEHLHEGNGPVPATIQEIIYDFKELNPGTEPESIQIGKTYKFPYYSNQ